MEFIKKSNAPLFLFLNAFLWGSSYVWSKMLLAYLPRFTILLLCSTGGLLATVVMFFPYIKRIRAQEILPSVIVTAFSVISNTFFMLALQHTTSSNAAFIVQSSIVITPLLMAVLEKHMPKGKVLISAFTALAGLFLITCSFENFRLNIGDIFALLNAVFFSLFLVGQNKISSKVNTVHFSFLHHATNTAAFLLLAGILDFPNFSPTGLGTYKFILPAAASVIIAIATVLFQSAAIRFVRPEKATVIYTLEPLTALVLGSILIGGQLNGIRSVIGCALIISAVLLSTVNTAVRRDTAQQSASEPKTVKVAHQI